MSKHYEKFIKEIYITRNALYLEVVPSIADDVAERSRTAALDLVIAELEELRDDIALHYVHTPGVKDFKATIVERLHELGTLRRKAAQ